MRSVLKLIVIAIALAAGFFASDIIHHLTVQKRPIDLNQYCMLSTTPCMQLNVSMSLATDTVHPLVTTQLSVNWPDTEAKQLELSLEGVEMEMGTVKFVLSKAASGLFQTDIILPVCTNNSMTWVGQLSDGKTTVLPAVRMER